MSKYVELEVLVHYIRDQAVLVSLPGRPDNKQWIPRSLLIEEDREDVVQEAWDTYVDQVIPLSIMRWKAEQCGLIRKAA